MQNTTYQSDKVKYKEKRDSILKDDVAPFFYKKLKLNGLGQREKQLEEKMGEIRQNYRMRYERMGMAFPPAQPFYKMKDTIEKCKLFEVFHKMPKGGLLHVHSSAALSAEGLITILEKWGRESDKNTYPDIYIVTREDAGQDRLAAGTLLYEFQIEREGLDRDRDVELLADYLKQDYNKKGLLDLLTLTSDRVQQFAYIWDEFQTIFSRTRRLFMMKEFYYRYHVAFFKECIADNIFYVELRCGYEELKDNADEAVRTGGVKGEQVYGHYKHDRYYHEKNLSVTPYKPDAKFLDELLRAQKEVQQDLGEDFFVLKVILCAVRALNPDKDRDKLLSKVDAAIVLQRTEPYKDLIIGFDFVSEEDRGRKTEEYVDDIIYQQFGIGYKDEILQDKMNEFREQYGYFDSRIRMIHFYLHDGESNWNDNNNVIDAAIISRHRIGHGFNMHKFQGCVRDIGFLIGSVNTEPQEPVLEICPISNQILGYYPDLRNHPAYELMKQGILCCVANDDPQIFGNPGLSYDFWEMYVGLWLNLSTIKAMVYIAYRYYYEAKPKVKGQIVTEDEAKSTFLVIWEQFVKEAATILGI
ncbi:MAG: hypothetical protein ACI4EQ_08950 [Lachnospiraceae bacterium]